jgi:acetamidase/formamidase
MKILYNDRFTDGFIGPSVEMLGPVDCGGLIVFQTAPGCWGPMITPSIKDGHEVNVPVAVDGANVGDAVVIEIKRVRVSSRAASSGVDEPVEGRFIGSPSVMGLCPGCGMEWPEAVVEGIGLEAIKCRKCGASISPYRMVHGYTMLFDDCRKVGLTVKSDLSRVIAEEASAWSNLPRNSQQVSSLIANCSDIVGLATRVLPFMGQLGTTPSLDIPASRNAGDTSSGLRSLAKLSSKLDINEDEMEKAVTDGHLDIDTVREGASLICPVKVDGGGVYAGDMHAQQGDGEIAGHTTDVSGELTVMVNVIGNLLLEGPLLIPRVEDLPPLARPFSEDEFTILENLASEVGVELEDNSPIQVIGAGADLNKAVMIGLERASKLFDMSVEEVRNRTTITGGIEVGRLPGIIQVTLKVPDSKLEELGVLEYVKRRYT